MCSGTMLFSMKFLAIVVVCLIIGIVPHGLNTTTTHQPTTTLIATTASSPAHLIDLTWPINPNSIMWEPDERFQFSRQMANFTSDGYWYAANTFCTSEHGGTHVDAPYHFSQSGWKVHEIPAHRLLFPHLAYIDLSDVQRVIWSSARLEVVHLDAWTKNFGPMEPNTVVLVKFNWSQFWPNRTLYMGVDKNGTLDFPGLSVGAAKWIKNNPNIVGVGVDSASVDPGTDSTFAVHRILSKHQLYTLENVKLIDPLPPKGARLAVMPMKIEHGTGAPTRIFAIVPKDNCIT